MGCVAKVGCFILVAGVVAVVVAAWLFFGAIPDQFSGSPSSLADVDGEGASGRSIPA